VHELEHHGLVKIPLGGRPDGIYWVRFYRGDPACVAVLTEVPGNPSLSLTNAISTIASTLAGRFSVNLRELVVFDVYPRHGGRPAAWTRVSFTHDGTERAPGRGQWRREVAKNQFTSEPEWWSSSRREVERLVGAHLPDLPSHEELLDQVRAEGGGTSQAIWQAVFTAVEVSELPPPHNPSSCHWAPRFEAIASRKVRRGGSTQGLDAGREFIQTITPEDLAACRYHDADWASIADESVRIVEELGRRDASDYRAGARRSALPETDRAWLESLFWDPVDVAGGGYTNGQHRGCALRFSGARRAAVVTDLEYLGEEEDNWIYEGDG